MRGLRLGEGVWCCVLGFVSCLKREAGREHRVVVSSRAYVHPQNGSGKPVSRLRGRVGLGGDMDPMMYAEPRYTIKG